jgi:hypothetical protein
MNAITINGQNNIVQPSHNTHNNFAIKGKLVTSDDNTHTSQKESIKYHSKDEVDFSNDAKLLSKRTNSITESPRKKAGVSSAREAWENDSAKIRESSRHDIYGGHDFLYMLRMDEPETYEKVCECMSKANEYKHEENNGLIVANRNEDKIMECFQEATAIEMEWFNRRCMSTGTFIDPIDSRSSVIESLEDKYSNGSHDLSINFYGKDGQDEIDGAKNKFSGASLWRYSTKFNLLLSTDMLKTLANGNDKEKKSLLDEIDKSVNNMKKIELDYEGNKSSLCLGVKFHADGNITYHANYKDCSNSYGIQANSADELLEKLLSD